MNQDLNAIRFVSERYEQLQGLRLVAIGTAGVTCGSAYTLAGAPGGFTGLAYVGIAFAMIVAGVHLAGRYYTHHLGRIVRPPEARWTPWVPVAVTLAITIGTNAFHVAPLTVAIAFNAGWALWIAIRDWPFRGYYLLAATACAMTLGLRFSMHSDRADALAIAAIAAVFIVIGLLDHRLLTSAMGSRRAEAGLKPCATERPE